MKTVVGLLILLNTVSAFGFDLGATFGMRETLENRSHGWQADPQVAISVGNTLTPNSRFRADAIVGFWSAHYFGRTSTDAGGIDFPTYEPPIWYRTGNRVGFFGGGRFIVEGKHVLANGRRVAYPGVGFGAQYGVQESYPTTNIWFDRFEFEGLFRIGIPVTYSSDILLEAAFTQNLNLLDQDGWPTDFAFYGSLGYRFRVFN